MWERQALTRARVVYGDARFAAEVMAVVNEGAFGRPWQPEWVDEVMAMRERLEASRPERDLKRGPGGLADVEFLVQTIQLEHGGRHEELRQPNTWQALAAMNRAGLLDADEYEGLRAGYDFLLRVQSRLRIVHNRTLDAVPEGAEEVEKLGRRLGYSGSRFLVELDRHRRRVRESYLKRMARERG